MPEQSFSVGELDAVVRALTDGATGLNNQAGGAPEVPDAGESPVPAAEFPSRAREFPGQLCELTR